MHTIQKTDESLAFHRDLGSKYTSDECRQTIKAFNMSLSYSYKGSPYDNAYIESFHAIIKKEGARMIRYLDYESAQLPLLQYIEARYIVKEYMIVLTIEHHKK